MNDPVASVYVGGQPVDKAGVNLYEASRSILVLESASEIQNLTIPHRLLVALGRSLYAFASGDTTSVHDGTRVLVSLDGRRYTRILTLDNASGFELAEAMIAAGVGASAISPGGANRVIGTTASNATAWLTGEQIAGIIDDALGSPDWRDGAGGLALTSRVDYLPKNAWAGMIGVSNRLVQMGDGTIMVCGEGARSFNGDAGLANRGSMRTLGTPSGTTIAPGEIYMGAGAGYFIDSDGWPWSWGRNTNGALGHGDTTDRTVPKRIEWFVTNNFKVGSIFPCPTGYDTDAQAVYFLETGGTGRVAFCGSNTNGAAGDGTAAGGNKTSPVFVGSGTPITGVSYLYASSSPITALARKSDGSWFGWGANTSACLGIAGTNFTSPQALTAMQGWAKAICGGGVTIALTADNGGARTAGRNTEGELGVGSTGVLSGWQTPTGLAANVVDVGCSQGQGVSTMWAITEPTSGSRYLYTWGSNAYGAVGDGTTTTRTSPYQPTGPFQGAVKAAQTATAFTPAAASFSAMLVRTDTKIYGSGYNATANLCIGSTSNVSTFTEVLGARGTIIDFAVHGYQQISGLVVLTDRGCFSGGYHINGAAGTGPTLSNETTLQQLDVPGIMGPQGQQGPVGTPGTADSPHFDGVSYGYYGGEPITEIVTDADGKVISAKTRSASYLVEPGGFYPIDGGDMTSFGYVNGEPVLAAAISPFGRVESVETRSGEFFARGNGFEAEKGSLRRYADFGTGVSTSGEDVLHIVVFAGQSNAEGVMDPAYPAETAIVATTPIYPDHALMLSTGARLRVRNGGAELPPPNAPFATSLSSLIEAADATNQTYETAASGCVNHLIAMVDGATGRRPRVAGIVAAHGSWSILQLSRGQSVYNWMMDGIRDAAALARAAGMRPVVVAVDWCQTETDSTNGTNPAVYAASLRKLIRDFNADISGITGQKERVVITVSPAQYEQSSPAYNNVALAHRLVMKDGSIVPASPTYAIPRSTGQPIHMTSMGQNRRGAALALTIFNECFGVGHAPLYPWRIVKTDATHLTLSYPRAVAIDSSGADVSTTGVQNAGFNLYGPDGTEVSISSVVASGSSITITTGASIPTGANIVYAQRATTGGGLGPVNGARGLVRASTGFTSIYEVHTIYEWAIPFIEPIS